VRWGGVGWGALYLFSGCDHYIAKSEKDCIFLFFRYYGFFQTMKKDFIMHPDNAVPLLKWLILFAGKLYFYFCRTFLQSRMFDIAISPKTIM
jgi:hypothetical protein